MTTDRKYRESVEGVIDGRRAFLKKAAVVGTGAAAAARAQDPAPEGYERVLQQRDLAGGKVRAQPALDGLRSNERRTAALLDAWAVAAAEVAGDSGDAQNDSHDS